MRIKNNNRGAVMVVLIVTFLIVTLLASSAIKYSYTGLQISKSYNNYSKKQYNAEETLQIIKAGIQNDCSNILRTQYDRMLDTYAYTPTSERNKTFAEYYKDELKNKFGLGDDVGDNIKNIFIKYINDANYDIPIAATSNSNGIYINNNITTELKEETTESGLNISFIIHNIRVNYSGQNGSSATCGADIIIDVPMIFAEKKGKNFYKSGFIDYALIANNKLSYSANKDLKVTGNIYAGDGGIIIGETADGSNVSINANYVNTRGDIKLYNGASLNIKEKDANTSCEILSKNIELDQRFDSRSYSKLDIKGIIYVEDDLEINIPNAEVKLSGEYTGYGIENLDYSKSGNITDNKYNGSSIIMNKTESKLDLSELYRMIVAGNAYITPSRTKGVEENNSIVTDETLTTRFMQIAYMVPSVCLSTHTNPSQYYSGTDIEIDYSKSVKNGGLDLTNTKYNISDDPIVLTIPGRHGTTLKYYFLRFMSKDGQQEYIKDYMTFYEDYMNNKAKKAFNDSAIILNKNGSYATKGNIISYDYNDEGKLELKLIGGLTQTSDRFISDSENAKGKANSINSTLKYNETTTLTDDLFDTIIYKDNIDTNYVYAYYTLDDYQTINMPQQVKQNISTAIATDRLKYDCIVYTGTDTFNIPTNMINGLVIAYGDVNLNHNFTGCIIAQGNINIEQGCKISNDSSVTGEYPLMYLLDSKGYSDSETIQSFFKHYSEGSDKTQEVSELDVRNLIKFDNWVEY